MEMAGCKIYQKNKNGPRGSVRKNRESEPEEEPTAVGRDGCSMKKSYSEGK